MDPKIWGPSIWASLIYIVAGFPVNYVPIKTRRSFRNLVNELKQLLPCQTCKASFTKYVKAHPVPGNRTRIIEWLRNGYNHSTKGDVSLTWFLNRHINATITAKLLVNSRVKSTGKQRGRRRIIKIRKAI